MFFLYPIILQTNLIISEMFCQIPPFLPPQYTDFTVFRGPSLSLSDHSSRCYFQLHFYLHFYTHAIFSWKQPIPNSTSQTHTEQHNCHVGRIVQLLCISSRADNAYALVLRYTAYLGKLYRGEQWVMIYEMSYI